MCCLLARLHCLLHSSASGFFLPLPHAGVRIENKDAEGALIEFDGGLIENVAYKGHWPVLVQGGGVHFKDTVVRDSGKRDWLEVGWRTDSPVTDVEGTVTGETTNGKCTESWNATRGDEHANLVVTCKKSDPALP